MTRNKKIQIEEPVFGFAIGILMMLMIMLILFGCGGNDERHYENYDSVIKAEHEKVRDVEAGDTAAEPNNKVELQMEMKAGFDTIR